MLYSTTDCISTIHEVNQDAPRRPLTAAVAAAGRGSFLLDGTPRMRERPIADLIEGLHQLGVDVSCPSGTGCPPVHIQANGLQCGQVGTCQTWLIWA